MYAFAAAYDWSYLAALSPEDYRKEMDRRKMARIMDKETNMRNRLERRRHAIWWKWTVRGSFFAGAMVAVPLFIKLVSSCWEWVLS